MISYTAILAIVGLVAAVPAPQPGSLVARQYPNSCQVFGDGTFVVRGTGSDAWDEGKLGEYGQGLLDNIRGCAPVNNWGFTYQDDSNHNGAFQAGGNLPNQGYAGCVASAIRAVGGGNIPCNNQN